MTALKRYMVNEWHREHTAKRGGFSETVPLDTELAERIGVLDERHELSPDALFDRRWALALLDQAMSRLEAEHAGENFDLLKECLTAGRGETHYAQLAEAMGTNEGAARVAKATMSREMALTAFASGECTDHGSSLRSRMRSS